MRLPLSKVYRAFPELDRFSDEQCRSFVKTAEKSEPVRNVLLTLSLVPYAIAGAGLTIALALFVLHLTKMEGESEPPIVLCIGLVGILWPAVTWLLLRDKWLRGAIARRILHCTCTRCKYSLLGLPVANGAVLCPECGATHTLSDLGLTDTDILSSP